MHQTRKAPWKQNSDDTAKIAIAATCLYDPVEWDPRDERVGEEFSSWDEGEHDPVCEPLRVVLLVLGLDGADGHDGRVGAPDQHVADQLRAVAQHQPQQQRAGHAWYIQ